LNRVELLLPGEDIPEAVRLFNELLGGNLPAPEQVPGQQVLATADHSLGIAFFGPSGPDSPLSRLFDHKMRRGSIGPLVWEVDDLDAAREDVTSKGYRIVFEFGEPGERELHLDSGQLFGYGITFTEHASTPGAAPANVSRFQRVELLLPGDAIEPARTAFNELLGAKIPPAEHLAGPDVVSTVDYGIGIELLGPGSAASRIHAQLDSKGAGAIGPLVWEVGDLDYATAKARDKGFRVAYEFGEPGHRQVHFDAEQLFGYGVTFTEHRVTAQ
jgi:hypothetical protein